MELKGGVSSVLALLLRWWVFVGEEYKSRFILIDYGNNLYIYNIYNLKEH